MRQLEVLQPRAIVFKGTTDHIFIPGTNELTEEFEEELLRRRGWQKSLKRLEASKAARVLEDGEKGLVVDASASPFGIGADAAQRVIDAQTNLPTLERWLRDKRAKGILKQKIQEQIALVRLDQEEQKS